MIDPSVFAGLLGGLVGGNTEEAKAKLEAAKATANDLSGLVKTKKKEKVSAASASATAVSASTDASSSKRKINLEVEDTPNGKRAKTEEMQD